MKEKIIKIVTYTALALLLVGNVYSFIKIKERDRVIDKLEEEIEEKKEKFNTSKANINELEYQVEFYEEMYGKYNFNNDDEEKDDTSSNTEYEVTQITYKEYLEKIENKETFVLFVSQTYCSHCIDYKPKFSEVINTNNITGYELDLLTLTEEDFDSFTELVEVSGTPTTIFYRNGEEITAARLEGSKSQEELTDVLKKYKFII